MRWGKIQTISACNYKSSIHICSRMATLKSLGLHEPSALPYLIAESILPQDPPQSLYTWKTFNTHDPTINQDVEEELLITERCVVWSRGGVVQRAYNLDVEGEAISHAFITHFVVSKANGSVRYSPLASSLPGSASMKRTFVHSVSNGATKTLDSHFCRPERIERGLVVILRSHSLVFLLSGDSHVIPLSFEVE